MQVKDVMTQNPVCCRASDTAREIARKLKQADIGSVPVISDEGELEGVITDRDLCCSILAEGLDPQTTTIGKYITRNPVTCRADEGLSSCEKAMQKNQIRRVPVIDGQGRCIGIVSQADLALKEGPEKVPTTLAAISKPSRGMRSSAMA